MWEPACKRHPQVAPPQHLAVGLTSNYTSHMSDCILSTAGWNADGYRRTMDGYAHRLAMEGRLGTPAQRRELTHCPHNHPYEEPNLRASKVGSRGCKACHRARQAGRDPDLEPTYL